MKMVSPRFLLLMVFIFQLGTSFAQDSTVRSRPCEYRTDGKPGAYGLRLSFWVPCTWTKQEATNSSILANYSLNLADSNSLSHTLTISKMDRPIPEEQLKNLYSTDGMKMIARQTGKYVSGSKIQIGQWDAAEVRYWNQYKQNSGMVYSYGVQYYIPMGDKIIAAIFLVSASDKEKAKGLFAVHETEFRTAAKSLLVR